MKWYCTSCGSDYDGNPGSCGLCGGGRMTPEKPVVIPPTGGINVLAGIDPTGRNSTYSLRELLSPSHLKKMRKEDEY